MVKNKAKIRKIAVNTGEGTRLGLKPSSRRRWSRPATSVFLSEIK